MGSLRPERGQAASEVARTGPIQGMSPHQPPAQARAELTASSEPEACILAQGPAWKALWGISLKHAHLGDVWPTVLA